MKRAFRAMMLGVGLVVAGCGSGLVAPDGDHGDFGKYLEAFRVAARANGVDPRGYGMVTMSFGELDEHEAGRCEWGFFHGRHVKIDRVRWMNLNEAGREALVFHELGHCVLKRDHIDTAVDGRQLRGEGVETLAGAPVSVMNRHCVPEATYERWRDYYVRELFDPSAPLPEGEARETAADVPADSTGA